MEAFSNQQAGVFKSIVRSLLLAKLSRSEQANEEAELIPKSKIKLSSELDDSLGEFLCALQRSN